MTYSDSRCLQHIMDIWVWHVAVNRKRMPEWHAYTPQPFTSVAGEWFRKTHGTAGDWLSDRAEYVLSGPEG